MQKVKNLEKIKGGRVIKVVTRYCSQKADGTRVNIEATDGCHIYVVEDQSGHYLMHTASEIKAVNYDRKYNHNVDRQFVLGPNGFYEESDCYIYIPGYSFDLV